MYRCSYVDLLRIYDIDPGDVARDQILIGSPSRTQLFKRAAEEMPERIKLPVRFDPGTRPEETNLLHRMVQAWGVFPISVFQHLDLQHFLYGYIGLEDYTMHPLIRPGSFVQIDRQQKRVSSLEWRHEFDRPIYFVELRDGYVCGWCHIEENQLLLFPHPLSPQETRRFRYPEEVEIVGRVTGVAMQIVDTDNSSPKRLLSRGTKKLLPRT